MNKKSFALKVIVRLLLFKKEKDIIQILITRFTHIIRLFLLFC